jgi:hypothetical protein
MREMAYLVIVIDPKVLMPDGEFPDRVTELSNKIRSTRPIDPKKPVRMPFERSATERNRRKAENAIEVPDRVEQDHCVGHQRQRPVEIVGAGDPAPELALAVLLLERPRRHAEQLSEAGVEVGEDAVEVEEQMRHPKSAPG